MHAVQAIAGLGLELDRHALRVSPRQVLIASCLAYRKWELPPLALRENVLVDFDTRDLLSGDRLKIGTDAELFAMFVCEPCAPLDRQRPGLSKAIGAERGVLARVARGGVAQPGEPVRVLRAPQALWSDDWRTRVVQVLERVPAGRWITFGLLAELAGVAPAYCRAFPRLLASLPDQLRPRTHSERRSAGLGRPWDGEGLHDQAMAAASLAANARGNRSAAS